MYFILIIIGVQESGSHPALIIIEVQERGSDPAYRIMSYDVLHIIYDIFKLGGLRGVGAGEGGANHKGPSAVWPSSILSRVLAPQPYLLVPAIQQPGAEPIRLRIPHAKTNAQVAGGDANGLPLPNKKKQCSATRGQKKGAAAATDKKKNEWWVQSMRPHTLSKTIFIFLLGEGRG